MGAGAWLAGRRSCFVVCLPVACGVCVDVGVGSVEAKGGAGSLLSLAFGDAGAMKARCDLPFDVSPTLDINSNLDDRCPTNPKNYQAASNQHRPRTQAAVGDRRVEQNKNKVSQPMPSSSAFIHGHRLHIEGGQTKQNPRGCLGIKIDIGTLSMMDWIDRSAWFGCGSTADFLIEVSSKPPTPTSQDTEHERTKPLESHDTSIHPSRHTQSSKTDRATIPIATMESASFSSSSSSSLAAAAAAGGGGGGSGGWGGPGRLDSALMMSQGGPNSISGGSGGGGGGSSSKLPSTNPSTSMLLPIQSTETPALASPHLDPYNVGCWYRLGDELANGDGPGDEGVVVGNNDGDNGAAAGPDHAMEVAGRAPGLPPRDPSRVWPCQRSLHAAAVLGDAMYIFGGAWVGGGKGWCAFFWGGGGEDGLGGDFFFLRTVFHVYRYYKTINIA